MPSIFIRIVQKTSDWAAFLSGFIIVFLIFANVYGVIMRYIFNAPVVWPLEISEFCMVFAVMLGTAHTLQKNAHVNINIFVERLSYKKQLVIACIMYALIAIFSTVLTVTSWELAWQKLYECTWSILRLPLFPGYIIVPIGGFLLLLQAICKIISTIDDFGKT